MNEPAVEKNDCAVCSFTNRYGVTYYLHEAEETLRRGGTVKIYFFSKKREGALPTVPDGDAIVLSTSEDSEDCVNTEYPVLLNLERYSKYSKPSPWWKFWG